MVLVLEVLKVQGLRGLGLFCEMEPAVEALGRGPGCRWECPGHSSRERTLPAAWSPGSPGSKQLHVAHL